MHPDLTKMGADAPRVRRPDHRAPLQASAAADDPSRREAWTAELRRDLEASAANGCVGSVLVSETERVRVWHLRIPPGRRSGFHRHVLDYFWTSLRDGQARTYLEDGRVVDATVRQHQTMHVVFGPGEHMVHCVENTGDTDLDFTTVEFLDGANPPLPVPDGVRLAAAG